jgi:tripartite-type tricarboxylate transporter receptor subunit TctC
MIKTLNFIFVALTLCLSAQAVEPPTEFKGKTVTIIVPFGTGGNTDIQARMLAGKIEKHTGVNVIVKNVPGAGAIVGINQLVASEPNGLTWGQLESQGAMLNTIMSLPNAHRLDTLTQVVTINEQVLGILVNKDHPANNLKEFMAWAKELGSKANYAHLGSINTLWIEQLLGTAGVQGIVPIPYKSSGDAVRALLTNEVHFSIQGYQDAMALVADGRLKWMAIGSRERLKIAPLIPTIAESYPGVYFTNYQGIFVPAATPRHIQEWINYAVNTALADPDVQLAIVSKGQVPIGGDQARAKRVFDQYYKERVLTYEKYKHKLNVVN